MLSKEILRKLRKTWTTEMQGFPGFISLEETLIGDQPLKMKLLTHMCTH